MQGYAGMRMTGWLPINTHVGGYCRHTCCIAVSQWNRTLGRWAWMCSCHRRRGALCASSLAMIVGIWSSSSSGVRSVFSEVGIDVAVGHRWYPSIVVCQMR